MYIIFIEPLENVYLCVGWLSHLLWRQTGIVVSILGEISIKMTDPHVQKNEWVQAGIQGNNAWHLGLQLSQWLCVGLNWDSAVKLKDWHTLDFQFLKV